ncbi:hypothetical protein V2S66_29720 [Streptomyces sp. V4-01]|uniref:Uncharacterized protein n=1 Tax=Actinacidiphila polyblastidii TaxID=3110430 RepID=A0ABU7PLM3_9ACTN|nr:hypothetical protein [Streptomyces sp. V4-01]
MHRSEPGDRVRLLQEAADAQLRQSFRDTPYPVYELRSPWFSPCALGESHRVDGSLQAVTLIYGPWEPGLAHVRVTTWHDLPGQDFRPDVPAALVAAPTEPVAVAVGGTTAPAAFAALPDSSWSLRVDQGPVHLLACGRGTIGDLAFERVTDLEPAVQARAHHLAALRA